jgi:tRNA(Ile)-lysidine synthase
VQPNARYEFDKFRFSTEILDDKSPKINGGTGAEYVDADRLQNSEMVLRSWSEGDAFVPLGMKTKKKISDFFVDAKIPIYEKHQIPILETKDGEVVWVCGQRIDDRFKITGDTKRVLKLEFSRTSEKANDKNDKGQR